MQITGYMTVDNLHAAITGYFFIELMDGDSQLACAFPPQALVKAQRVLGGS